jgi:hypothetical protein
MKVIERTIWMIEVYVNDERQDMSSHTSSDRVYVETLRDSMHLQNDCVTYRISKYHFVNSFTIQGKVKSDAQTV